MSPINTLRSTHVPSGASGPHSCLPGTDGAGASGDERGHGRGADQDKPSILCPPMPPRTPPPRLPQVSRKPQKAPESPSIQRQQLPTCSTCAHLSKNIQEKRKRKSLYLLFSQFSPRHCGRSKKRRRERERITISAATAHPTADCCLLADGSGLEEEGAQEPRRPAGEAGPRRPRERGWEPTFRLAKTKDHRTPWARGPVS